MIFLYWSFLRVFYWTINDKLSHRNHKLIYEHYLNIGLLLQHGLGFILRAFARLFLLLLATLQQDLTTSNSASSTSSKNAWCFFKTQLKSSMEMLVVTSTLSALCIRLFTLDRRTDDRRLLSLSEWFRCTLLCVSVLLKLEMSFLMSTYDLEWVLFSCQLRGRSFFLAFTLFLKFTTLAYFSGDWFRLFDEKEKSFLASLKPPNFFTITFFDKLKTDADFVVAECCWVLITFPSGTLRGDLSLRLGEGETGADELWTTSEYELTNIGCGISSIT